MLIMATGHDAASGEFILALSLASAYDASTLMAALFTGGVSPLKDIGNYRTPLAHKASLIEHYEYDERVGLRCNWYCVSSLRRCVQVNSIGMLCFLTLAAFHIF